MSRMNENPAEIKNSMVPWAFPVGKENRKPGHLGPR